MPWTRSRIRSYAPSRRTAPWHSPRGQDWSPTSLTDTASDIIPSGSSQTRRSRAATNHAGRSARRAAARDGRSSASAAVGGLRHRRPNDAARAPAAGALLDPERYPEHWREIVDHVGAATGPVGVTGVADLCHDLVSAGWDELAAGQRPAGDLLTHRQVEFLGGCAASAVNL